VSDGSVSFAQEEGGAYMNSINCLKFSNTNENIFLTGSRDGYIKMYDLRSLKCGSGS
jgi:WD40 repeat protein